ncbi:MAG: acyltransferase [Ruminococcus sp.]|nr:acyltransferase [Ruminococcus sp.]
MRKNYIDNIRWITIICVVIYHVVYMFNGVQTVGVIGAFRENQWQDGLQYLLYPWFMVLLFVVSGMSSRYYLEKHTEKEFFKSRTNKLLVPSTLGLFVFQWIQGYFSMKISNAFEDIPDTVPKPVLYIIMSLSGIGVLWFIQLLWVFSALLIPIRRLEKDKLYEKCRNIPVWALILLVIPLWGMAQILNTPVITVYRCGIYGFAFLIGYFIFSHDEIINRLEKLWYVFAPAALILGIVSTIVYFGENYTEKNVLNSPLSIAYAWAAVLGIISCGKKFLDFRNKFTGFMASQSWGIYIFHYLYISIPAYYMINTQVPPVLQYIICTVLAFAGSIITYNIISRIPVIRYLVLGMKGVKKNVQR